MAYTDPTYYPIWQKKYGKETLLSFKVGHIHEIPSEYVLWMKNLPKVLLSQNFVLSHAGVDFLAKDTFEDNNTNRINTLFRDDAIPDPTGKYRAIIGHRTHSQQQCLESTTSNLIYVDAGCGKRSTGKLVAYCLDDNSMTFV